jgi:hypothetical protein
MAKRIVRKHIDKRTWPCFGNWKKGHAECDLCKVTLECEFEMYPTRGK